MVCIHCYSFAKVGFRFFSPASIASWTSLVCSAEAFHTFT